MNLKEIIKTVRRIELKTKSFSSQNFSGMDRSAYKGLGMNFSEVREYHFGNEGKLKQKDLRYGTILFASI